MAAGNVNNAEIEKSVSRQTDRQSGTSNEKLSRGKGRVRRQKDRQWKILDL